MNYKILKLDYINFLEICHKLSLVLYGFKVKDELKEDDDNRVDNHISPEVFAWSSLFKQGVSEDCEGEDNRNDASVKYHRHDHH